MGWTHFFRSVSFSPIIPLLRAAGGGHTDGHAPLDPILDARGTRPHDWMIRTLNDVSVVPMLQGACPHAIRVEISRLGCCLTGLGGVC